jgi:hypothetical protein
MLIQVIQVVMSIAAILSLVLSGLAMYWSMTYIGSLEEQLDRMRGTKKVYSSMIPMKFFVMFTVIVILCEFAK